MRDVEELANALIVAPCQYAEEAAAMLRKLRQQVDSASAVAEAESLRLEWCIESMGRFRVQGSPDGTQWQVLDCRRGLSFLVTGATDSRTAIDQAIAKLHKEICDARSGAQS